PAVTSGGTCEPACSACQRGAAAGRRRHGRRADTAGAHVGFDRASERTAAPGAACAENRTGADQISRQARQRSFRAQCAARRGGAGTSAPGRVRAHAPRPGAADRTSPRAGPDMSSLDATIAAIERVILGKGAQVRLCLACLLARGHLLIEDVPGVGKTTLAQTLARVLGLEWSRLQLTSEMLPVEISAGWIVDRIPSALPEPFFVAATQNPHEQIGTYGLPESQLDRFLMRVSLGYPDPSA